MSSEAGAEPWFEQYGLADVLRVSDPETALYRLFSLRQGRVIELIHPRVWGAWFRTAIQGGFGAGRPGPNWRQLTGVFVIYRCTILAAVGHRNSAARPDYAALVRGLDPKVPHEYQHEGRSS